MADESMKYIYPVDELDKIIEQMNMGIQPMISDEMMTEVQLRIKEINKMVFDEEEEEDDVDAATRLRHQEMIKQQLQKERRKATTHNVIIIDISDEQKQKIREEMSESIVRPDPNNTYNKNNDELFTDIERKKIFEKLKSLKNCYYTQQDWVNAMKIIYEAIDVSLGKYGNSDYPWLSYEEAVKQFNEGKIKFRYCEIPKLYVNYSSQISDPQLLKGIMTGDVILKSKSDDDVSKVNKNKKYEAVSFDYEITGDEMYHQMIAAHKAGYDTPMSTIIKHKSTVYNPTSLPFGNRFSQKNLDKNGEPILFDWSKEGAGESYFNMVKGRKTDSTNIMRFVNSQNDDMINGPLVTRNAQEFLKSMKGVSNSGGYDYMLPNYAQPAQDNSGNMNYNMQAAQMEQELLASIKLNNPTK